MFDYRQELERRVAQFAGYLKKMHHRAHEEIHGNCFIIFSERPVTGDSDEPSLSESVKPALEVVAAVFDDVGINNTTVIDHEVEFDLPDEGWREDDSQDRFIQFSFERNWFCVDLPLQTLFRNEVEKILRSRNGFFYVRDRPEFTLKGEEIDGYDPFRKVYIYGDEESAAEDMAFILFQVWRFPVDWRFFVTAAPFGDKKTDWENGTPVE
jgi:hypothetical protein